MDGPNTNWKVFELLFSYRNEKEWSNLLNLGSFGVHSVHGTFRTDIKTTNWEVEKVLKAMFKLFHDSPARRDLYIQVTENDKFPLRYKYIFQSFLEKFFFYIYFAQKYPKQKCLDSICLTSPL